MADRTMADRMPDDAAQLWYLIRRAAGLMDRHGDAMFRTELGISLAQFLVLSVVDAYPGPLSQQKVADRLGLTKGTVSRQIEAAAAAGLMTVETAGHTRRENAVTLTAAGSDLVRRGDALMDDSRRTMVELVGPEGVSTLNAALERLIAAMDD